MKKLITIAAITIVALTSVNAQAQTKAVKKEAITVVTPRQAVQAHGVTIVLSDSQINYLRGFKNAAINSALDSHSSIQFNELADNIISLLHRQLKGNKTNYYASFNVENHSSIKNLVAAN